MITLLDADEDRERPQAIKIVSETSPLPETLFMPDNTRHGNEILGEMLSMIDPCGANWIHAREACCRNSRPAV